MLTGVVLTHNEQANLDRCLESLKFCDQVLVIDDNSTDDTVQTTQKHQAQVIQHPLSSDFATQRNYALSQIKSGWILFVDADEVVPPELATEITGTLLKGQSFSGYSGYFIPRVDYLWGKRLDHGDTKILLLRLARRGAGEWVGKVHETWQVSGSTATLTHPLLHYPHPTVTDFLRHINYYSTLRAGELHASGYKTNIFEIIFYPVLKFLWLWIWKLGFADGVRGFISAMMMAFYSFLVRGKLYLSK
ncbi:glycosyltransferase family 2 protein [Candidatus Amesbacteria bacterium]|nr:glycosyltransferase family 2 protein [Candidatus Amesbacteria bacterium]